MVEDDGKGISPVEVENGHSFGILGMRERAAVFGGKLSIHGESGVGTRVCVTMPMAALGDDRGCTDS
jgi:signal transduction histidine kinase